MASVKIPYSAVVSASFLNHLKLVDSVRNHLSPLVQEAGILIGKTLQKGNKILLAGNGGSAADAQHIAAELTGRFMVERKSLPAIALTTDTSALTAIGNDYGFDLIFSRQIEALGSRGDVLVAISTSGNSENIIKAVNTARHKGLKSIGLTGKDGGLLKSLSDLSIQIPSYHTARIQETHILIGHIFCELVDLMYSGK